MLCETVYYADGTRAGVKTPDDGYWTTRYIGSLIYEGEPGQETLEGIVTDVSCIFMQVDPMAEKYYGMTPYGYCINSPINFLDPFGLYSVTGNPPDNLYGTPDYYLWRQEDLYKRGLIASPTVSTYYNDFGYKYACKFLKLSSELSESGKKWVKDVMLGLQYALDELIKNDQNLEMDLGTLKEKAYRTHRDVYIDNGVAKLLFYDLVRIFSILEPDDMNDEISREQVSDVLKEVVDYSLNNLFMSIGNFGHLFSQEDWQYYVAISVSNFIEIYSAEGEDAQNAVREIQDSLK